MSSPHRSRRIADWVVLLALVMAALAPGISHALAHAQGELAPWSRLCTADRPAQPDSLPTDGLPSPFDHCPYCAWAGDTPALPASLAPSMPPAFDAGARPMRLLQAPRTASAWRAAQPRAPPLVA